jgi:hypothetical protein
VTAQDYADQIRTELGSSWLPQMYSDRILKMRTRSYHFEQLPKSRVVSIHHTLLGVELKIGNRRLLIPDLATARYLAVFARAGCTDIAVPYDITKVSQLADELESSWYRMLLLVGHKAAGKTEAMKTRIRGLLIARAQAEILQAGAGTKIPAFRQTTRQRH